MQPTKQIILEGELHKPELLRDHGLLKFGQRLTQLSQVIAKETLTQLRYKSYLKNMDLINGKN